MSLTRVLIPLLLVCLSGCTNINVPQLDALSKSLNRLSPMRKLGFKQCPMAGFSKRTGAVLSLFK